MPAFRIDAASDVPPYEQLRVSVVTAIAAGELSPGAKLPTVRGWAAELGVAPGTVARAVKELEAAGVIETRGRAGTFVALSDDPVRREAERAATEFAARIRALGIDAATALTLASDALDAAS